MLYRAKPLIESEIIMIADSIVVYDHINMILGGNRPLEIETEEDMHMYKIYKNTRAELYADLNHEGGKIGEVTSDPDPDNNREYIKVGIIGLGHWGPYSTKPKYANRIELLAADKAYAGLVTSVDNEPGNIYLRSADNTQWIPRSGNTYLNASLIPTNVDFYFEAGFEYVDQDTGDIHTVQANGDY